jgi:uncharacterized protein (TIGR00251 family)
METARLQVKLTPRAEANRLVGWLGDRLKVHLTSPPVDGQANHNLLKFLGKSLKVAPSKLDLCQGITSREKTILITGLSQEELWSRLDKLLPGRGAKQEDQED